MGLGLESSRHLPYSSLSPGAVKMLRGRRWNIKHLALESQIPISYPASPWTGCVTRDSPADLSEPVISKLDGLSHSQALTVIRVRIW